MFDITSLDVKIAWEQRYLNYCIFSKKMLEGF